MTKTDKTLLSIGITGLLLALFGLAILYTNNTKVVQGSVMQGGEYHATTTDQTWLTTAPQVLVSNSGGSLGSVVITTIGTGSLTLYDATTTDITKRAASLATSTLVLTNLQITTSLGTYTFDRAFYNGLIAVWVGTNNATSTITYRSNQ